MRSVIVLLVLAVSAIAQIHPALPTPGTLDGLGVNIHFTEPQPGELEMIRAAGFRWVRMDLTWATTEPEPGRYDFAKYDSLVAALEKAGLRAYFILDYGHPKFADAGDKHPFTSRAGTQEFRDAFAKWAVAAVGHFKGRGIVWELWNEPNIAGFWKPKPDVQQYIALAKTVAAALEKAGLRTKSRNFPPGTKREAAGECLVGPATSVIDLPFLDACFAAGLLDVFDAISVHPYRQGAPESVAEEYRALRLLIRRYCAADALPLGTYDPSRPNPARRIPILSGEWGWSAAWPSLGKDEAAREATQAKYLPRMFLTNVANDIPLSIWYDWRDDGDDDKEAEHRFGIVRRKPTGDAKQPFEPKPAYTAMKVMCEELKGMRFNRSLRSMASPSDSNPKAPATWLLIFTNKKERTLIPWIRKQEDYSFDFELPASPAKFRATSYLGDHTVTPPSLVTHRSDNFEFRYNQFVGFDSPTYLRIKGSNEALAFTEAIPRLPLDFYATAPAHSSKLMSVKNPLNSTVEISEGFTNASDGPKKPGQRYDVLSTYFSLTERRALPDATSSGFSFSIPHEGKRGASWYSSDQSIFLHALNPLRIEVLPKVGDGLLVMLHNPAGAVFSGKLQLEHLIGVEKVYEFKIAGETAFDFKKGEKKQLVRIDVPRNPQINEFQLSVLEPKPQFDPKDILGNTDLLFVCTAEAKLDGFVTLPESLLCNSSVSPDGDAAVASTQSLADGQPAEGASVSGTPSVGLRYRFGAGWKFVRIEPKDAAARNIEGRPKAFGIWVYGDGQGGTPCIRLRDATGQVHQVRGEPISWKGWRYIIFPLRPEPESGQTMIPLPDSGAEQRVMWSHWGGANDGVLDLFESYPIQWDTLFLLDGNRQAMEGEIFLSAPTLIY